MFKTLRTRGRPPHARTPSPPACWCRGSPSASRSSTPGKRSDDLLRQASTTPPPRSAPSPVASQPGSGPPRLGIVADGLLHLFDLFSTVGGNRRPILCRAPCPPGVRARVPGGGTGPPPPAVRMTAVWAYLTGQVARVSATWSSTRCNRAPARRGGGVRRAPGARYTRPHLNPHHSALANEWESPCCGAAACVRLRCVATERSEPSSRTVASRRRAILSSPRARAGGLPRGMTRSDTRLGWTVRSCRPPDPARGARHGRVLMHHAHAYTTCTGALAHRGAAVPAPSSVRHGRMIFEACPLWASGERIVAWPATYGCLRRRRVQSPSVGGSVASVLRPCPWCAQLRGHAGDT